MSQRQTWNIAVPIELYFRMEEYLDRHSNETLSKVVRSAVAVLLEEDERNNVLNLKTPPTATEEP